MIAIIDYGAGNAGSVKNAFDYLGVESVVTSDVSVIKNANRLVFPGVGSFGDVMALLREKKLDVAIREFISSGKPFLGICVGMQVLFEKSEESPGVLGLGVFKGEVVRFTQGKVPQIGWNSLVGSLEDGEYVYFVNSYVCVPGDESVVFERADYNGLFCASVREENVWATQYHPEKSGEVGLNVLRRWLQC